MLKKSAVIYRFLICFSIMWIEEYICGKVIINTTNDSQFWTYVGVAVCIFLLVNFPLESFFNLLFPLTLGFSATTPILSAFLVSFSFFVMNIFPYYFSMSEWKLFLLLIFSVFMFGATTIVALVRFFFGSITQKKTP